MYSSKKLNKHFILMFFLLSTQISYAVLQSQSNSIEHFNELQSDSPRQDIVRDDNLNLISKVDFESRLARAIIKNPTYSMRLVLKMVSKFGLDEIKKDPEVYFKKMNALPTRPLKLLNKKIQHVTGSSEVSVAGFLVTAEQVLLDESMDEFDIKFEFICLIGSFFKEHLSQFRAELDAFRYQDGSKNVRVKRENSNKFPYFGLYALLPGDARTIGLELELRNNVEDGNGLTDWQLNENNWFIQFLRKIDQPAVAGPSGTMGELVVPAKELLVRNRIEYADFESYIYLAAAFLVHSGHHSFTEAISTGNFFLHEKRDLSTYQNLFPGHILNEYIKIDPKIEIYINSLK